MSEAPQAVVVDAGGLIAVERKTRRMREILSAVPTNGVLVVPAPVLAQVWRGGPRQALLSRFLNLAIVEVDLLSRASWLAAGLLCGRAGTSDVVDAAVVACAHTRETRTVITSDPDDLHRLDPGLTCWTP